VAIPATYDDVAVVRTLLPAVARGLPFTRSTLLRLEICVMEALHNVVRHAYRDRDDGDVEVSLEAGADRLVIRIEDHGRPMPDEARRSIRSAPPITERSATPLPDLPEGGLGIPILRTVLDDLEYRREGDRNVLTMTKLLGADVPREVPSRAS
jgi:serine/threonine-protein kinase RsbW